MSKFLYRVAREEVDALVKRFYATALDAVAYDNAQDGLVTTQEGTIEFLIRGSINNTTLNNAPTPSYPLSDSVVDLRLVAEETGSQFVLAAYALSVNTPNVLDYTFICSSSAKLDDIRHALLLSGAHPTRVVGIADGAVKNSAPNINDISNLPSVKVYPAYLTNSTNGFYDEIPTDYLYTLGDSDAPQNTVLVIGGRNYIVVNEGSRKLALYLG